MFKRGARGFAATAAGLALAALAAAGPAPRARADDAAPPAAAPPAEGMVESLSKKLENLGVARNPLVRDLAKKAGIATDPGTPADFIVNSRPRGELDYVAVGRKETEHPVKIKTPADLKAMEADFDAVKTRHDAIRATFAPSVKAVADAAAARAARAARPKSPRPAPVSVQ
ncbi:MAG: hypothetical protein ABSG83_16400 [Roseiarcus sp.]|jgi:hypothetical protein